MKNIRRKVTEYEKVWSILSCADNGILYAVGVGTADLTQAQQTAVKALCDAYAITQTWELTNICSA